MEFWSPVFWVGNQVPCLQMTIYSESSDYPKVINFCGIFFFFFAITLDYLIKVHGRLLFSEKISRVDALIRWWTLINFLAKFQGGRLFHCGRLLIFAKLCVI